MPPPRYPMRPMFPNRDTRAMQIARGAFGGDAAAPQYETPHMDRFMRKLEAEAGAGDAPQYPTPHLNAALKKAHDAPSSVAHREVQDRNRIANKMFEVEVQTLIDKGVDPDTAAQMTEANWPTIQRAADKQWASESLARKRGQAAQPRRQAVQSPAGEYEGGGSGQPQARRNRLGTPKDTPNQRALAAQQQRDDDLTRRMQQSNAASTKNLDTAARKLRAKRAENNVPAHDAPGGHQANAAASELVRMYGDELEAAGITDDMLNAATQSPNWRQQLGAMRTAVYRFRQKNQSSGLKTKQDQSNRARGVREGRGPQQSADALRKAGEPEAAAVMEEGGPNAAANATGVVINHQHTETPPPPGPGASIKEGELENETLLALPRAVREASLAAAYPIDTPNRDKVIADRMKLLDKIETERARAAKSKPPAAQSMRGSPQSPSAPEDDAARRARAVGAAGGMGPASAGAVANPPPAPAPAAAPQQTPARPRPNGSAAIAPPAAPAAVAGVSSARTSDEKGRQLPYRTVTDRDGNTVVVPTGVTSAETRRPLGRTGLPVAVDMQGNPVSQDQFEGQYVVVPPNSSRFLPDPYDGLMPQPAGDLDANGQATRWSQDQAPQLYNWFRERYGLGDDAARQATVHVLRDPMLWASVVERAIQEGGVETFNRTRGMPLPSMGDEQQAPGGRHRGGIQRSYGFNPAAAATGYLDPQSVALTQRPMGILRGLV